MTKQKKIFNLVSLLINFAIVIISIFSLTYAFRNDIIRENAFFNFEGWTSFRFFTNLSNLYVAIASGIFLVFNIKNYIDDTYSFPFWAFVLKFSSTVAVSLTFVLVVIFLSPLVVLGGGSYFTLFYNNSFLLHFTTPVLAIITHILFEKHENFSFRFALIGLIPTVVYSLVYLVMVGFIGENNGGWADFYGLTFGGNLWLAPFSMLGMYALTLGIIAIIFKCQKVTTSCQMKSVKFTF